METMQAIHGSFPYAWIEPDVLRRADQPLVALLRRLGDRQLRRRHRLGPRAGPDLTASPT